MAATVRGRRPDLPEPRKGLLLEDSSLLLQAAAEGRGIA